MERTFESLRSFGGRVALAVAVACSLVSNAEAWSISGTVKDSKGAVLAGVAITVKDSATYQTTTSAAGTFTLASPTTSVGESIRLDAFAAQVSGGRLEIRTPMDGPLDLSLVDASGRSVWNARVVAVQGLANTAMSTANSRRAIFLRIRHEGGVEYMPVRSNAEGISLLSSQPAARALASFPTLVFKKSGYLDTTYAATSATATGVTVTMSDIPATCNLPTTFKWKDYGGPVASPKNGWTSIKDFTYVNYNNQHIVYMTYYSGGWKSGALAPFTNWSDAANATQTSTNTGVAPELMYFTPKKTWIMSKQWCSGASFCWMESNDVTKPTSFVEKGKLLTETITVGSKAPIDQVLICDDNNCFIFYADDNGHIYRGSMPKANFPGTFSGSKLILTDTQARLFEAVEVYKIKGQQKYLMIVECMGSGGRYFRAFTATDLGGAWTSLAGADTENSPFAGKRNVTFTGSAWSSDISHGDILRGYDETRTIDPCNLQMIYQGYTPPFSGDYGMIPYKMGLLTLTR